MVVTDDVRLKITVGTRHLMPGCLAFDEKSRSNRSHHGFTSNVMNEIMHRFARMRDENFEHNVLPDFCMAAPKRTQRKAVINC
jgi:hypothetical protein